MALHQRGQAFHGDAQYDIREKLTDYSCKNGYPSQQFADAVCQCGGRLFRLFLDEGAGAAVRSCKGCGSEHPIGDSGEYLDDASLEECECPCGVGDLEITAGVALYEDSEDVRWLYIGCRCPACGLTACYGDWKNEYLGYQKLLARV